MLVVYYCAVDISDYIVLSRCKMCSIVIFAGVKLLAQLLAQLLALETIWQGLQLEP